jgi:hypothetical protein
LNLLPLASTGGGQALLALFDPSAREIPPWKASLLQGSMWLLLALAVAWTVAIGFFVSRHCRADALMHPHRLQLRGAASTA